MNVTSAGLKFAVDQRRTKLGLTQEQLAEQLGIARTLMLGRIDKVDATGSLELIYMLAEALGMRPQTLLTHAEKGSKLVKRKEGRK